MFAVPFMAKSTKTTSLAALVCFFHVFLLLLEGTHGLKCHTCNPCDTEYNYANPPTFDECDETPYENLPDKGYMGCSYEITVRSERRKRCIWLRYDPDELVPPPEPRPLRCHLSPVDDIHQDCYCFTDGCNEEALAITTPPPAPGQPGGPLEGNEGMDDNHNHGPKVDASTALCSVFGGLGIILQRLGGRP